MKYETSVVYLEQVPKVTVDTGFDLATFLSFMATIAVFAIGTWLTIWNTNKSFKKQREMFDEAAQNQRTDLDRTIVNQNQALERTIASQELVARQNSLKASRQAWINDLRDVCADYVAAVMNIQRLNNYWEGSKGAIQSKLLTDPPLAHQMQTEWADSHIGAMKEAKRLKCKIELLLNPEEEDSKQLMGAAEDALRECDKPGAAADEHCAILVEYCQTILKQEWEKAKVGR
ncbi:TPA: hypothetical protein NID39_005328 [Pseudomonas aeruginosa]|uniref:hypothetical protein n=1 Tax=Pseudomonas aeruginosa TaxID=287 RepID=UPI00032F7F11|nr:hypothetical protein [Pseudomonas aeruginosa]EOQ79138.1 hypothetical protein K652_18797 [Pseudomonas aeruginosa VRFPA02]EIU3489690.1 hypothetical protein [Pseudomonas aeruginosa]KAA5600113.1 hypothetical protein F3G61_06070 [Pseudomonas aeruginosa]KSN19144.1 hypothetical protein APA78_31515 [Pseudomonas aeruginosa]MBD1325370.1 hypothetical protein [Pseudomonas aeruginosa]